MRRDLITALVLVALGAYVIAESARMPRYTNLGVNPYTVPGIVPAVLGAVIALLATLLLLRAMVAWRRKGTVPGVAGADEPGSAPRLLLTLALTLGYGFGLVGQMPFWLATFLFVWAFLLVFEVRTALDAGGGRALARVAATSLLEAGLVAAAVTFVFQEVFLVTLP